MCYNASSLLPQVSMSKPRLEEGEHQVHLETSTLAEAEEGEEGQRDLSNDQQAKLVVDC